MVQMQTREQLADQAIIHDAPSYISNAPLDRSFELPTRLYVATAGLFLAYIATMVAGFAHAELLIPAAIFVLFIVSFFVVPAIWTRLEPETPVKAKCWARFKADGIMTATGPCTAGAATAQVLVMPVLLAVWGVAVVTIAAVVG